MTIAMNPELEKLTTHELNNLFLKESQEFLKLLNDKNNQEQLQAVKQRVRDILAILDARKKSGK